MAEAYPVHALLRLVIVVVILLSVEMHIVTRQAAASKQNHQDNGPPHRVAIPRPFSGESGRRSFHRCKSRARSEKQFYVPRHQIQVRLPPYLAP
jgi:hypothetical protein